MNKELTKKDYTDDILGAGMYMIMGIAFLAFVLPAIPIVRSAQQYYEQKADEIPQGWVDNYDYVLPTGLSSFKVEFSRPGQTMSLINDGPGTIEVRVNEETATPRTVAPSQFFNVDLAGHILCRLFLSNTSSKDAVVHIAIRG